MTTELFNVVQFFENGVYEYVRRNVPAADAVEAFKHYCNSLGAQMGMTVRVIITDQGDCTNAVWEFGKGITYPKQEEQPK